MANTYVLISSNVLGSATGTVTFSSIPSTYTDLVLQISARTDKPNVYVDTVNMAFNNDSTSNYSYTILSGDSVNAASTNSGGSVSSVAFNVEGDGSFNTANIYGSLDIYIPNYTSTASRPFSTFDVTESNFSTTGRSWIRNVANLYRGSSAISSIAFSLTGGANFLANSSFYLYGIKKN